MVLKLIREHTRNCSLTKINYKLAFAFISGSLEQITSEIVSIMYIIDLIIIMPDEGTKTV